MNLHKIVLTASLLMMAATNSCSQKNKMPDPSLLGIFTGSTPCSEGTRPLPGIAANADCKLMKWKLTLYQDAQTKAPTTYRLHCTYGLPHQGTTGLIGGGKKVDMKGKWTIRTGTTSSRYAILYQLHDDQTGKTISFIKLDDNLLHLLDSELHLMIGSAAWSYTLNKTK